MIFTDMFGLITNVAASSTLVTVALLVIHSRYHLTTGTFNTCDGTASGSIFFYGAEPHGLVMIRRRLVFRPFSFLYFAFLFFLLGLLLPYLAASFRDLLVRGLGLPVEVVGFFLFMSLVGSFLNVPLLEVESRVPIYVFRSVKFFGVSWRLPKVQMGVRKTLITLNVGGALLPIVVSAYLLLWSIPACSLDPMSSYTKALVVLTIVTLVIHRSARLVKGLGIATPAFVPPVTVVLATLLVDALSPVSCPAQIAYIGGTLGTLIGADLLNLNKVSQLGAPVISIGGAGTFDGIYTTGIVSVLLILMLL